MIDISKTFRLLLVAGCGLALSACAMNDVHHRWCPPEEPEPEPQVVQEEITLEADALFKFDRGDRAGMLAEGRAQLDELADKLHSEYVRIERIHLVGHTDRLGPADYNQQLSLERANTVADYLRDRGIETSITTAGKGLTEPVTTGCEGDVATAELIACLQPDRRVEINITGIQQREEMP